MEAQIYGKFNKYKRLFLVLVTFVLLSSLFVTSTLAQQPKFFQPVIVQSFDSPYSNPEGLAWDGQYLWNSDSNEALMQNVGRFSRNQIYQLDPSDGHVVRSFDPPGIGSGTGYYSSGLTWDGQYLWYTARHYEKIYRLDPSDGHVVYSFSSPGTGSEGLAWDGQYLWNADLGNTKIYQLDPSDGQVIRSFDSPGSNPAGLAWDGQYLWHADWIEEKIYKLDSSDGQVIQSFDSPGPRPTGLAWDGQYLWNADIHNKKIYKLDVSRRDVSNLIIVGTIIGISALMIAFIYVQYIRPRLKR